MQDLLRSRRGLVVSAAVVILCIIGFFLVTASDWRPFLNNARQPVASAPPATPPKPNDTAAQQAAVSTPAAPKLAGGSEDGAQTAVSPGGSVIPPEPSAPHAVSAPAQTTASTPRGEASTPVDTSAADASSKQSAAGQPPAGTTAAAQPPGTFSSQTKAPAANSPPATAPARPNVPQQTASAPSMTPEATAPANTPPAAAPGRLNSPQQTASAPSTMPDATAPASHPAADAGTAVKPTSDRVPSFDILRVEPTGDSVIAARGAPNAEIDLLDGGTAIAHATADGSGQVAFLPPPLKPGEHSLMLSMKSPGGGQTVSSQSVAVSIPAQPRTAPMVALIQPNQPAAILSGPVAGSEAVAPPPAPAPGAPAPAIGPAKTAQPAEPVAIRSVEVETMGSFYAAGRAPPGSKSRIYLNDAYVATVTAGPNGNWSLRINRGMKPGHYEVRADQVERDGRVAARAQVPFDYPAQVASASAGMEAAKKKSEAATAVTTAPSPAGSAAAPNAGQAGPNGAASAGPGGGASLGATDTPTGGAVASPPRTAAGMGGGNASAGAVVAALGGADGVGTETQAGTAAGPAGLPAAGGQPLPAVNGPSPPPSAAAGGSSPDGVATPSNAAQFHPAAPSPSESGAAPTASQASPKVATPDIRHEGDTTGAAGPMGAAGSMPSPAGGGVNGGNGAAGPAAAPAPQGSARPSNEATQRLASTTDEPASPHPEPSPPGSDTARRANATSDTGAEAKPQAAASAAPASESPSAEADEPPTVVEELVTARVVHGDSLWRISRHMLGHGIRYTQIYAANTQEIRDPSLIFPGQVFVMPQE